MNQSNLALDRGQTQPKHYCGVFGVYGIPAAAEMTYYGLYALQHRGQESAGIVACEEGFFHQHRGMGLVPQVFSPQILAQLRGPSAIGHTRYSTAGSSTLINAQPLTANCVKGRIAIAHNGNLTNALPLRRQLEQRGLIFQTSVDSEIILCLLAQPDYSLPQALRRLQGAYSLVILTESALIGARDPHGFRPLSIGQLDGGWILASETCALDLVGARFIRDVEPGEIVTIDTHGLRSFQAFPRHKRRAFCIFEFIYFARPDSRLLGRSVYEVRVELGRQLAREHPRQADVVVPIPDSGNCAALGYSQTTGIPLQMAFVRNHYVGRSFLLPAQSDRNFATRVKLNLITDVVRGKRVVLVDDSIVRGTTCVPRIKMLREAGVARIDLLVSCPPHQHSCPYGIDFPNRRDLIAARRQLPAIQSALGVDYLGYLSHSGMIKATGLSGEGFCSACYTGVYPEKFGPELRNKLALGGPSGQRSRLR